MPIFVDSVAPCVVHPGHKRRRRFGTFKFWLRAFRFVRFRFGGADVCVLYLYLIRILVGRHVGLVVALPHLIPIFVLTVVLGVGNGALRWEKGAKNKQKAMTTKIFQFDFGKFTSLCFRKFPGWR